MKSKSLVVKTAILFVLSLGGCCSKPVVEPLFKDAAIQDSLQCFLERIDSVPNHYNAPSLYAVRFNLKDQDSLIRFGAYTGLWMYEVDTIGFDTRTPNWIGWEEFESQYHDTTPWDDDSFYYENCEKTYLYKSPDNLHLISRRIGRPDPDFKDWPETIDY